MLPQVTVLPIVIVFVGAGTGGVARYLLGEALAATVRTPGQLAPAFPWPTLIINLTGCLAAGAASAWLARSLPPDTPAQNLYRLAISVGFLGGYTTFSAFGRETLDLLQSGRYLAASVYVLASVAAGLAAVWAGQAAISR